MIVGVSKEPSIVGTLATALAAVLAVVVGRERQTRLELRQKHREHLSPIYAEALERVTKAGGDPDPTAPEFYRDLKNKLLLFAPPSVVRAWIAWGRVEVAEDSEEIQPELFIRWENVLRAIRSDLGHDDGDLRFGDLQRLYIDDIDVVFGPFETPD